MTEIATLARPYAEAAFKHAKQAGSTDGWADSLQFLSAVVGDAEMAAIVKNPKVGNDKLLQLLLDICQDQVNAEVVNLVKLLVENGKIGLLPQISKMYEQYKADDEGYVNVDLYSAYTLTKAEQTKYVAMLEKHLNKKVHAVVSVDKSLIGGIFAKAGDIVIDGSVRGQLHQLAKRL
ncbi:MAG: F0F1 ATP synthase subunit delta [Methylomonas sp.]|jgi:F-type H+-transporting ATPase subunit delta|nr:MAG: F0F1 ATP synthase subunit delta [Methylomonas sp.]